MGTYDIEKLKFNDLESSIKLPKYQRPVVWTKSEKESFISSLHEGFPFGSLLLYKYPDDLEGKYTLIDGQQRYTTMQDYVNNPTSYFPIGQYTFVQEMLAAVGATSLSSDAQNDLAGKFEHIIKEMLELQSSSQYEIKSYHLRNQVRNVFPIASSNQVVEDKLLDLQQEIIKEFDSYLDLDSIIIPCVIFKGDEGDLPEVFARVNLGGRKLTKYQVFAAQWNRYPVHLENTKVAIKLLENVIERYQSLTDDRGGLEIEDFDADEMRDSRKVTLPEFCHSLGQEILHKTPACWPESILSQDDTVDTIGYNTLAIIFGIKPQNITSLAKSYHASMLENDSSLVSKMVAAILGEYEQINQQFAQYLRKPGPTGDGASPDSFENSKALSQHQFLSFFAALWKIRYGFSPKPTFEPLPHSKSDHRRTVNNLFGSYLIDSLSNQWKGSGDSRLASYLDGTRNYLTGVTRETLHSALTDWWEQERKTPSINIDTTTKILLTIFVSANRSEYRDESYDYEHIIARKWLNEKENGAPRYKTLSLPGGRLGNIMLLSSSHNRRKGANNLGRDSYEELVIDGKRNFIPSKSELEDIEYELRNGDPTAFREMAEYRTKEIFAVIESRIIPE